jgi:DNA-binding NarL/FixJ family response regulator
MIRILIADDHELIRQGVRQVLQAQRDWQVCGEAVNGREAVAMTLVLKPDVLVLDFSLPDLNGLEVTRQVRAGRPETEVLILTMHESTQLARELQAAGVRGFVFKSDAGRTLVTAIQHLLQHRPYVTGKLSPLVRQRFSQPAAPVGAAPVGRLTPREREIVRLIAEGRSSKEVAEVLAISVKTVDTHRANLMRKLAIHSVSELVRYALRERIATP